MKRPLAEIHSGCDATASEPAARRRRMPRRSSNSRATRSSTTTIVEESVDGDARAASETQHQDSGSDHQLPSHVKPKATTYLNSRAEGTCQESVTEASKHPRNDQSPIYIIPYYEYKTDSSEATAQLILQSTKTPAKFVEHVFRSLFVPEIRKFFAERIRKLLRDRRRKGGLSDTQQEKLRHGLLRLGGWEASSQSSAGPFSLQIFHDLIEVINDVLDENPAESGERIVRKELMQDSFTDQIVRVLRNRCAPTTSLGIRRMTWVDVLRALFYSTAQMGDPEAHDEQWRGYIISALQQNHIHWILGASRGHITPWIARRLSFNEQEPTPTTTDTHRLEGSYIDLGHDFINPRSGIPCSITLGFQMLSEHTKLWGWNKPGLVNHYSKALELLEELQDTPQVKLLFMLALTVGMTRDMLIYRDSRKGAESEPAGFALDSNSRRPKRGPARLALLVLRMLWFLKPQEFVWDKAKTEEALETEKTTIYSIQSVHQATIQYKIKDNMLTGLRWPADHSTSSSRGSRHMSPSDMAKRLEQLRSLMTEPTEFIGEIFGSHDPKWIEQCEEIIKRRR
ncbi:hypothetical protein J3F83DRAFT_471238 [Trichoderma novae-zelandiae]